MKFGLKEDFEENKFFDQGSDEDDKKYDGEESIDPLDAYMNQLTDDKNRKKEIVMETEDPMESYLDAKKKQFKKDNTVTEDQYLDSDGELDFEKIKKFKKNIVPLETVDHSQIQYKDFNKEFYEEHEDLQKMTDEQASQILKEMDIRLKGIKQFKPIVSFGHLGFDQQMMDLILKKQFQKPTAIQCVSLPLAMKGHDVIGIAKTGSGKTYSYVWPLLIHILDQPQLEKNEGPIGIILAPTRELTQQIYMEVKQFAKLYQITSAALLGGESKHEQWKNLKAGIEILVCTPGRLIEMIKKKATNFLRTTYVVLDEADKMFQMGFEPQVRSILKQIRPDRQTLFFSATFKKNLQTFAADCLNSPVVINIGKDKQSNENIHQLAYIFKNEEIKLQWVLQSINQLMQQGKVILFVNQIKSVLSLQQELEKHGIQNILTLHGDKIQQERTQIINEFKTSGNLLVATDVASRGLDIKEVQTVVNVEIPKDLDTHIHRIGRTGRGEQRGMAYSLLTLENIGFAVQLCKNLEISGQEVPKDLMELALCDDAFKRKIKQKQLGFKNDQKVLKLCQNAMKRGQRDNKGLGFRDSNNSINDQIKKQAQIQFQKANQISQQIDQKINQQVEQKINEQQINEQQQKVQQQQNDQLEQNKQSNVYVPPVLQSREEIRSQMMGVFKSQMQTSFRSNFVSKGEIKQQQGAPQISFRKSEDADNYLLVQNQIRQEELINQQIKQQQLIQQQQMMQQNNFNYNNKSNWDNPNQTRQIQRDRSNSDEYRRRKSRNRSHDKRKRSGSLFLFQDSRSKKHKKHKKYYN